MRKYECRTSSTIRLLTRIMLMAVSVLGAVALSACGSPDTHPAPTSPAASRPGPAARPPSPQVEVRADLSNESDQAEQAASLAVVGHVTWPDGVPASGVTIEFFPSGFPYGGQSDGEQVVTAADGSYSLTDCPCPDLGGLFVLPPTGGDWAHGGNQCNIMLAAANGQLTGSASPGDQVDWSMLDMPCARDYILPQNIRSEIANIESDPQALSGGPWQNARARVGG